MNLNFEHAAKHSLLQIKILEERLQSSSKWSIHEALRMVNQLICHAHPASVEFLNQIEGQVGSNKLLQERLAFYKSLYQQLRSAVDNDPVLDQKIIKNLYSTTRNFFHRVPNSKKIIVILTTAYNNFGISNLALYAILRKLNCSLLILKDTTMACYMRGVNGFGINLQEVAKTLIEVCKKNNIDSIYLMGYSSGGYAACYLSQLLSARGCLVFSAPTDMSANTDLPLDYLMSLELRQYLHSAEFVNLKQFISEDPDRTKIKMIVGELWDVDLKHAKNLEGHGNVQIEKLSKCFHNTPEMSIVMGVFDKETNWLINL